MNMRHISLIVLAGFLTLTLPVAFVFVIQFLISSHTTWGVLLLFLTIPAMLISIIAMTKLYKEILNERS